MDLQYKDLSYIKSALQAHQGTLKAIDVDDESYGDDEFAEIQDDIMYIERLIAMFNREIKSMEDQAPKMGIVAVANKE